MSTKNLIKNLKFKKRMDKYRKVKIVGKGNFGHAVLVQSVNDRKLYIMKVGFFHPQDHRCISNGAQAEIRSTERSVRAQSNATPLHRHLQRELHG